MRPFPLTIIPLLFMAGTAAAEPVTFWQALQEAVRNRPLSRAARHEAEAAEAAVGEARSRLLPRLTLEENLALTNEPAASLFIDLNQEELELSQDPDDYNHPGSRRDFETRLRMQLPLFDPNLYYGLGQARAQAAAAAAEAVWSEEEAAFAAFRTYLQVQQALAALKWAQSSLQEAEETFRLSSERNQAGLGLKADVLRARVNRAEAERRQISAENDLAVSRRALALAIGRDGEVEIAAALDPAVLTGNVKEEIFQREDLEAIAWQERRALLAYRQSRAAWLPRLEASAAYTWHDSEAPFGTEAGSWAIGAGLSWEVFSGFGRHYASKRAAAEVQATIQQRLEAWRQAQYHLAEAKSRAREAKAHFASAQEAVGEAHESHRLSLQRFEAGLATLSDLLTAQSALDRARFDAISAESRYTLALGNILYQQGIFTETLLERRGEERQ